MAMSGTDSIAFARHRMNNRLWMRAAGGTTTTLPNAVYTYDLGGRLSDFIATAGCRAAGSFACMYTL
jgi:hypothetical protein